MDYVNKIKNSFVLNRSIIALVIIGILIIFVTIIFSKKNRVKNAIVNSSLKLSNKMFYQTDYCSPSLYNRKLVDFHVKSSYNSAFVGNQNFDYVSSDMVKNILSNNVRYLEFSVFSKELNSNSIAVVSNGYSKGEFKLTANVVPLKDILAVIKSVAFYEEYVINYNDPLFIYLDLNTDNVQTLDSIADDIKHLLGDRLVPTNVNIVESSVCDLMDKVIFMSNSKVKNSKLNTYINASLDSDRLQRLTYSDVLVRIKFNVNAPDFYFKSDKISFHKGISYDYITFEDYKIDVSSFNLKKDYLIQIGGASNVENNTYSELLSIEKITDDKIFFKKNDKVNFVNEKVQNEIFIKGFKTSVLDASLNLPELNKDMLTIVIPDYDFFSRNFNPKNIWYSGCQFVAMNYSNPTENLDIYQHFFAKRAIKLKASSLLRDVEKIKEKTISVNSLKIPDVLRQRNYDINFDFISNYIENSIQINPFLNESLLLSVQNFTDNLKLSVKTNTIKSLFFSTLTNNEKLKNSIHLILKNEDQTYYLGNYSDNKLEFKKKEEIEDDKFLEQTSFLPLKSVCRKEDTVSFGFEKKEKINDKLENILYYIQYKPKFTLNNSLFINSTNNYRLIKELEFNKRKSYILRPLTNDNFKPLGDIIVNDSDLDNGDLFSMLVNIHTSTVFGAVKHPVGYTKMYSNKNKIKDNKNFFAIWKPIPPDGYIAVGNVMTTSIDEKPPKTEIVFTVRADLLEEVQPTFNEESNSLSSYSNKFFDETIGIWSRTNNDMSMRYFTSSYNIDKSTGVKYNKDFTNTVEVLDFLKEPNKFDNPIYSLKIVNDPSLELKLSNRIQLMIDKEVSCFKIKMPFFDSKVFTEYNYYDNINKLLDNDYKILSYKGNRSGNSKCLSVPYSYWNDFYAELSKTNKSINKSKIVTIEGKPGNNTNSEINGSVITDFNTCNYLSGNHDGNKCNMKFSVNSVDPLFISKYNSCEKKLTKGNVELLMNKSDCEKLGGNYNSNKCKFDLCYSNNKNTLLIPNSKTNKEDICKNLNKSKIPLKLDRGKCSSLNGKYDDLKNSCELDVCYNPTPLKSNLVVSGCKSPDYFGTNFLKDGNNIKLKNNKNWCVSCDENSKNVFLEKCNITNKNQHFDYTSNKNLKLKNSDKCISSNSDNTVSLDTCNPLNYSQKWLFNHPPPDYCLHLGAKVFYLDKSTFKRTQKKFPGNVINTPIENLLMEEYDFNFFHVFVGAIITKINRNNNIITYKPLNNSLQKLKDSFEITTKDAIQNFIVFTTPKENELNLGTKVLIKNGVFNYDIEGSNVYLKEDEVMFYAVIVEKLENLNYKVFTSINSIEADRKNRNFGRPYYPQVLSVNISKIILFKNAPLC